MRISDWSSDVCSSDLVRDRADAVLAGRRTRLLPGAGLSDAAGRRRGATRTLHRGHSPARGDGGAHRNGGGAVVCAGHDRAGGAAAGADRLARSEEHTSELQSLMRNSYAVFCLKKKITNPHTNI